MTAQAEKLREALRIPDPEESPETIALTIVSELGITPEMVEVVEMVRNTASLPPPHIRKAELRKAAAALAVLLEVAGVQTEVNDGA